MGRPKLTGDCPCGRPRFAVGLCRTCYHRKHYAEAKAGLRVVRHRGQRHVAVGSALVQQQRDTAARARRLWQAVVDGVPKDALLERFDANEVRQALTRAAREGVRRPEDRDLLPLGLPV